MKIIGIIPARFTSTRFPGKPLALIAGKPITQHVVEQAELAKSSANAAGKSFFAGGGLVQLNSEL